MKPLSLHTRLVLILMGSMIAIQVLSFGGVGMFRGFQSRQLRTELLAKDVALIHRELKGLSPVERRHLVKHMQRGNYQVAVVDEREALPAPTQEDLRSIHHAALEWVNPSAAISAAIDTSPPSADGDHVQEQAFTLSLDKGDVLYVRFDAVPASTRPPIESILLYLLLISLIVLGIAAFAVRLATRPLALFTQAAKRLTTSLNTAPLSIDGPAEVREAALAFNAMHTEIQRQLQERSQILAAISHDLKTPLTRMKLRLGSLEANEQRTLMEADVDAMADLVQDGVDYAHSQQLRETRKPVDINHLVQGIVDQAVDMGHDCEMSGHCPRAYLAAPRALERVLQNLVDNGLRYGTKVRIQLLSNAHDIELQVSDNGAGLPAELLEKVFTPYFRAETSRNRVTGGTGLGLTIARNLVEAHGGHLWLEPGVPEGLVAKLRLPYNT